MYARDAGKEILNFEFLQYSLFHETKEISH